MQQALLIFVVLAIAGSIFYLEAQRPATIAPGSADIPISPVAVSTSTVPPVTSAQPKTTNTPKTESVMPAQLSPVKPAMPINRNQIIAAKSAKYPRVKELVNPSGFINIEPFTLASLVGKRVIIVDFWTYSCINCQRTLPYLTAWDTKYREAGLTIVGVHTPEFDFEKIKDNVITATKKFGVRYPVVQDNDYATWQAYGNRFWPHKYLIDIDGFIVYDHIGEGAYAETEQKIQELLQERAVALGQSVTVSSGSVQPNVAGPSAAVGSPEIYFGAGRNEYLANGERGRTGTQTLTVPSEPILNSLYLGGVWRFADEFAENQIASARVVFRYRAKNVYVVASADTPIKVSIKRDGVALKTITIQADQLYTLVNDQPGVEEHTLELIINQPGVRFYTFTFG